MVEMLLRRDKHIAIIQIDILFNSMTPVLQPHGHTFTIVRADAECFRQWHFLVGHFPLFKITPNLQYARKVRTNS